MDADACTGCGSCVDRCHVSALRVEDGADTVTLTGEARCIGCGLCVSECPTGALSMNPRDYWQAPKSTFREVAAEIAVARGKM